MVGSVVRTVVGFAEGTVVGTVVGKVVGTVVRSVDGADGIVISAVVEEDENMIVVVVGVTVAAGDAAHPVINRQRRMNVHSRFILVTSCGYCSTAGSEREERKVDKFLNFW